jgi:hypothetical protein
MLGSRIRAMAKCFTQWTVLPHEPIEKHSDNLWSVSGKMPGGNQRRMAIIKRADGGLIFHNPIALGDEEMRDVEAFGTPAFVVVPNAFHRMDSIIFKQRYPGVSVLCPQTARKRVSELVEVAGHMDEMPKDDLVGMFHLRGMKQREGAITVRSNGKSALVFNDTLLNLPQGGGAKNWLMAPVGTLSVPRFARWMLMKDGAELKQHLQELAATPGLAHVVPGHGDVLQSDVSTALSTAAERL